ncbi:ornithine carbamoyltransferase [Halobacillus yeomjeoni]|uniref:Ornithine carbamoyltransferase n=1 Tax=Halobacillus yeomjeoni TaxID=311194 RepID=A0A931HVS7_9BACI|nr:ornithine carbamoyltransferase [Halobacillus yeomjeoni]MBH0230395.1 ornithine carbamoyltransferase [Halobacillus yeomjeoni]
MNLMKTTMDTSLSIQGRHLLSWTDFSQSDVSKLLSMTQYLKENPYSKALSGKVLALLFEKSSTRTRVSFEVGMTQMGGHALYLNSNDIQLGRGESIHDTAKVLSGYVDGIMYRTTSHEKLKELSEHATVPVINGLCDLYHPCQALADLFTIVELKGSLKGMNAAFIGDGNNVAHSFMILASMMGVNVKVATPKGYEPDPALVEKSMQLSKDAEGAFQLTHDPEEAVQNADIIYTDVWTSMGQEEETEKRLQAFEGFQVNERLMSKAEPDAHFLHCLPAHREEEVTTGVIDGPQSAVFQQAENRLHAQKAILQALLASENIL